jgi:hypothetical protein
MAAMQLINRFNLKKLLNGILFSGFFLATGCGSLTADIVGGTAGSTTFFGNSPSHQFEQVYYLGVFDPQEQLPETIYRVIVRGQAGAISFTNFASGWVPAQVVDSLGTNLGFARGSKQVGYKAGDDKLMSSMRTGRRMMLFGPEGFREAPADHRLVIVMGSDPNEYFKAIDSALGTVSEVQVAQLNNDLRKKLTQAMMELKSENNELKDLETEVKLNLAENK